MSEVIIRPKFIASVSGGKDSLYMLNIILNNPGKYPLDYVFHSKLEIDWPWTNDVLDQIDKLCKTIGIPFYQIKPRKSWNELYSKYDLPNRVCRWCNKEYKLDSKRQINKMIKELGYRPVHYIGYCADETKRFKYNIGDYKDKDICYPLAEENINEIDIHSWAKNIPVFNNWYKYFYRQGCMYCPFITRKALAYMYLYYNDKYNTYLNMINKYEVKFQRSYFDKYIDDIDSIIRNKWIYILNNEINQISLF